MENQGVQDDESTVAGDEGAQGALMENQGAQGAPTEGSLLVETVEDDYEAPDNQEAQGASIEEPLSGATEEHDPPAHNLRGTKSSFDYRFSHQQHTQVSDLATLVNEIIPQGPVPDAAAEVHNHNLAVGYVFNQMSAKKGVKIYGDKAVQAIVQECKQLDEKKVFDPVRMKDTTAVERKNALRSINLIKEKRSGKIKARTVADGSTQRPYVKKEDSTSPTVSIEALMISIAIDAKEGRVVATADVEGAYLHADMDDAVLMLFEGDMVDYMVQANPGKYEPYVYTTKKGKKLLYVKLLKALYGCIKSALLWYKLFTSTLEKMGFVLNPYDPCVANKMINGNQCTICWFVDDLKTSHMERSVVDDIIAKIEERYGKMVVTHGKKHKYVGMDIEFTGNGEAKILVRDYIEEAIAAFPEDCSKPVRSPAAAHLFEVNDRCGKLNEKDMTLLHHIVAKLLFVARRARPDVQVAIAFLTSRVTKSDRDDWKKLKRLLQYLNASIDMPLTLSIDDMSTIKTWVDAAYALHSDMKSHTGGVIMMGKGALYGKSSKQKLNTKSSTEAEVVGSSDFLPQTLWTHNFIKAQGYKVKQSDYYQDNMSAMAMEKNGRASAGQKSRHIDIRYFFIKDRIASGEINLLHCPTGIMIADFFTKPLQGVLFEKFRDIIMGITHFSTLTAPTQDEPRSVLDEVT
jgi:hypothetical protein